ncbi:hypothetical protein ABE437_10420 [Isoptericola cucumis]|uniref:hypothetical protein n=1 Tax=Isoptericola cucumis TaxID=1776856 RepID=UPI003207B994
MVRRAVTAVLLVLAVLVTVVTIPARYVEHTVLDTEGYLEVVGPLASEPAVQEAVSAAITREVTAQIDVQALVDDALSNAAGRERVPDALTRLSPVVGPALANQVDTMIARAADRLVQSQAFVTLWISANEVGHGTAARVLEDRSGEYLDIENGVVSVPLDPFVEEVRDRLVDRGLTIAERIEPQGRSITLFESDDLAAVSDGVTWLDRLTPWLPVIVLALVAAAAWVAGVGRRLRTVAVAAGVIALVMLVLQAGVQIGNTRALDALTLQDTGMEAVRLALDAFLTPLRGEIWRVFWVSAVVSVVCFAWPWAWPRARRLASSRRTPAPAA